MKILHVINNLGAGGAEKLIEELVPRMNGMQGVKAEVLLLTSRGNVFDKSLKDRGVKIKVVPIENIRSLINIYYIRKYIIEGKYDVVHAHLFTTNYWVSLASKCIFKDRPILVTTEHSTHNRRREKPVLRNLEKYIYSSYDKIISISDKTQENILKWLKFGKGYQDKFVTIFNGVNIERFKDAEAYMKAQIHSSLSDETKLLCMAGSFSKQKDQSTIIRAMKSLPEDIHLVLVGEGELKQVNQDLAKELNVENRVHFLGFRNDIERIFKASDIIIVSSHWEGFGLVAAEGMASGKPVIASNVDGLREVVEASGLLFEKGDYKQLGIIIRELFSNKDEYEEVSQACLERVKGFSIEKMVTSYIDEYKKLLNYS